MAATALSGLLPRRGLIARRALALGIGTIALGVAAFAEIREPPSILMNASPSEPLGLYVRTLQIPRVGRIIAFNLPSRAFAYVDLAEPELRHRPLIKEIAAGPGDRVCTRSGTLVVNGTGLGPIIARDGHDRALPRWVACRKLDADELFVFSRRVPNSFDSRYYGPVSRKAVLGVFQHVGPAGEGA